MFNIQWPDILSVIPGWSERPFDDISQMTGFFLFSAYNFFISFFFIRIIVLSCIFSWEIDNNVASNNLKPLIEKSRECHNHKRQPTSDTKRKRKRKKQQHAFASFH